VKIPDQEIVQTSEQSPDPVDDFRNYALSPEALAIAEQNRGETLALLADFSLPSHDLMAQGER